MNWAWLRNKGQSILEVILALAVFALFAAAMVSLILGSFETLGRGGDYLAAAALAEEGIEAARSIRDGAWNESVFNQSAATSTSGEWQFVGEGTDEQLGKFHRVLTFSPVCRDGSLNLTICPAGQVDLHSREARAVIDWINPVGTAAAVERQTLFTNWDSHDWVQTDWSGGSGQSLWSDGTRYGSDDSKVNVTTVGQLKLANQPFFWSAVSSPVTQVLNSVHCRSADDCFTVGNAITSGPPAGRGELILNWNGANWLRVGPLGSVPNVNLSSIFCLLAGDCWVVGSPSSGELIIRYSGGSWTRFPASGGIPNVVLNDVFCVTATDCWAVGAASGGELIIRWNGSTWSRVGPSVTAPDVNLNSVFCLTVNDCWAAGASGVIIGWNGGVWSLSQDTGVETWNDMFMLSAADGFVVGSTGAIRRWNGADWNTSYPAGSGTWRAVEMISAADGFVVGSGGESRRFNGADWNTVVNSGTAQTLNSLVLTSPRTGWSVGDGGVIRQLTGGGYETSGELVSSAFDMTDPSPVQIIEWDEQIPVCVPVSACNIKFQIRTAPDVSGAPGVWTAWYGNAGPASYFTAGAGSLISTILNGNDWVQYRVELAGDGNSTPILNEVRINYK